MVHYNTGKSWSLDRGKASQEIWEKAYRKKSRRRGRGWWGEKHRHKIAAKKGRR